MSISYQIVSICNSLIKGVFKDGRKSRMSNLNKLMLLEDEMAYDISVIMNALKISFARRKLNLVKNDSVEFC